MHLNNNPFPWTNALIKYLKHQFTPKQKFSIVSLCFFSWARVNIFILKYCHDIFYKLLFTMQNNASIYFHLHNKAYVFKHVVVEHRFALLKSQLRCQDHSGVAILFHSEGHVLQSFVLTLIKHTWTSKRRARTKLSRVWVSRIRPDLLSQQITGLQQRWILNPTYTLVSTKPFPKHLFFTIHQRGTENIKFTKRLRYILSI